MWRFCLAANVRLKWGMRKTGVGNLRFDISSLTGLPPEQTPRVWRDKNDGLCDPSSLAAQFGDLTLNRDPRELWIGRVGQFGRGFLGVKPRRAQTVVSSYVAGGRLYRYGAFVVTVVASAEETRRLEMARCSATDRIETFVGD